MKTWQVALCAIATAICTWLSTEPVGSAIAAILAPAMLIYVAIRCKSSTKAALLIFLFQLPLWLFVHKWVYDIAIFGWIGIGLYMSIWAPLFVLLLKRVENRKAFKQISIIFTAPIIWVGLECMRGIVLFDGYPWYLAGTGIADSGLVNITRIGSVWAASFLVVLIAALLVTAKDVKKISWIGLVLIVVWTHLFLRPLHLKTPLGAHIAVIQTNVPQSNKVAWTWEQQQEEVRRAIELTYKAIDVDDETIPFLIVWPETMLPGCGFELSRLDFAPWMESFLPIWYWAEEIKILTEDIQIPILIGTQTWLDVTIHEEGNRLLAEPLIQYNSAVLVMPDGTTQRYDKTFLTPFGERMPYVEKFPMLNDWVREKVGVASLFDLEAGRGTTIISIPYISLNGLETTIKIGTPICFEDTIPSVVRNLVWKDGERQVDLLINLSNDGWFGDDDAARLQHNREASMRCLENNTVMIRAANTGASSSIWNSGNIRYAKVDKNIAFRESTVMYTRLFKNPTPALFSVYIGDGVAWTSLFASILLIGSSCLKRSSNHVETD